MSRSFEQAMGGIMPPHKYNKAPDRESEIYERSSLALQQIQILLIASTITKAEAFSMIKMINSKDRENLTLVELSIEKFLTTPVDN